MKFIIYVVMAILLSSCAYNYSVGVDKSVPLENVAEIKFSNHIKVSEIDGKPFSRKASIWVDGSHSVRLPSGIHRFKFKYNAVSLNGGFYTDTDTVLSYYLRAGEKYEISHERENGQIYFKIQLQKPKA